MELITAEATAKMLGVTENYLAVCRMKGKGPAFVRIGRAIRYSTDDLRVWINAQRVSPD